MFESIKNLKYRKCFKCKLRDAEVKTASSNEGIYSGMNYFYYHQECLETVLNHPRDNETFVDRAIAGSDIIKSYDERIVADIARKKERLESSRKYVCDNVESKLNSLKLDDKDKA